MDVFVQSKGESIVINGDIGVTILDIDGDDVVLAIDTTAWMGIDGNEERHWDDEPEEWNPLRPR